MSDICGIEIYWTAPSGQDWFHLRTSEGVALGYYRTGFQPVYSSLATYHYPNNRVPRSHASPQSRMALTTGRSASPFFVNR